MTLEQFLRLPEVKPPLEFAPDGTVTQKMSPKGKHSLIQLALIELVLLYAGGQRLATPLPELRAIFGGAAYVPDLAVYRSDRIPRDASGQIADDFLDPPDIAFEIVSPRQSVTALSEKCVWYVDNGVPVALIVDPLREVVVVFGKDQAPRTCHVTETIVLSDALPGFHLDAAQLFSRLRI